MSSPLQTARFPLLVIDIGNTSTVLGLADETLTLTRTWRVRTNRELLPDDLALQLGGLFGLGAGSGPGPAAQPGRAARC